MKRESLEIYDVLPPDMENYLRHYGRHFSEKMCEFAVSKMRRRNAGTGRMERVEMIPKQRFDELMTSYGIELENDVLCDGLYVYNMAKSDFFGSSLPDEKSLCQFVKDYVDDADQADGFIFNRFYADMSRKGEPIPWERCL